MLYKHLILSGQSIPDTVQMQHSNGKHFSSDDCLLVTLTVTLEISSVNLIRLYHWCWAELLAAELPHVSPGARPVALHQNPLQLTAEIVH